MSKKTDSVPVSSPTHPIGLPRVWINPYGDDAVYNLTMRNNLIENSSKYY